MSWMRRSLRFRQPYPEVLPDPDQLGGYPKAVETYLFRLRSFYHARAVWHRRFFRFSGIMVVLIGAFLPLVTTMSYAGKDLVVSLMGVVVAALTALRAFYRWDQSWILLRGTERTITGAWWGYQARVTAITSDGDDAAYERHAAARELAAMLVDVRQEEADFYFKDLRFPSGKDNG